jgi:soluble lytic murein transglycosylase-like protein
VLTAAQAAGKSQSRSSSGERLSASKPQIVRRYEVREDAETGRLVRVATRVKVTSEASRRVPQAGPKPKVVQGESGASSRVQILALVVGGARRHDVDPKLVHAVIRQESGYDPFAVSSKGAMGLMQLMPATADRFGVQNIFDPAENVRGGVLYLRHLLDRYNGDSALSLAAYNAGEGAVDRYGDIPPYRETVDYVSKVRRMYGSAVDSGSSAQQDDAATPSTRVQIIRRVEPSGVVRYETE